MLVKDNQPELLKELRHWFDHPLRWRNLDHRTATTTHKGHGRIERRTVTVSAACGYLDWPGLEQVMLFETTTTSTSTGEIITSHQYAITSLPRKQASAARLLGLRRQHWAIENNLHYPRDVWFGEDASRVRSGQAPRVMASFRNLVLNLLRGFGYTNIKSTRELFAARPHHAAGLLDLPVSIRLE